MPQNKQFCDASNDHSWRNPETLLGRPSALSGQPHNSSTWRESIVTGTYTIALKRDLHLSPGCVFELSAMVRDKHRAYLSAPERRAIVTHVTREPVDPALWQSFD